MSYNYREGKKRIIEILNSPNDVDERNEVPNDSAFDYGNAIIAPVASVLWILENHQTILPNNQKNKLQKWLDLMSANWLKFLEKIKHSWSRHRGDCVYSIYSADSVEALESIIDDAANANTIIKMLNELLAKGIIKQLMLELGDTMDRVCNKSGS